MARQLQNREKPLIAPTSPVAAKPAQRRYAAPMLRVMLKVTEVYEGEEQLFIYDADTLSSLVAEQEARSAARKKRFKYFKLVSVTPIG